MCDKISNVWQTKMTSIKERIGFVYNNELLTDVEFLVDSEEEEKKTVSFHAHKFILTLASPVFASILFDMKAKEQTRIALREINHQGFGNLLKYVYTDEINLRSTEDAFRTYKAADQFKLPVLKKECERYLLRSEFSPEALCRALEKAESLNMSDLKNHFLTLIEQKTKEVLNSAEFKQARVKTIESILKLPRVALSSECELLRSVIEWGLAQPSSGGKYHSLRHFIQPLLPYIRITSCSLQELTTIFGEYPGLFSESEALAFFMNFSQPGIRDLPSWCNTSKSRDYTRSS